MKKIVVYSKQVCPYCVKAKSLLKRKNLEFQEIMVADEKIMNEMIQKSGGRRTVPQIFIGETHIGGCDDLYALEEKGGIDKIIAS